MKKLLILFLSLVCIVSVLGCNKKNQAYFDATVIENGVSGSYTVEVTDKGTSNISVSSKVFVYGDKLPKDITELEVGDSVRVYFGGLVSEISPLDLEEIYKIEVLK